MTDKERIRAEVERLIDILERNSGLTGVFGDSQMAAYEKILSFIDSMQEEHVSEVLEEAANDYAHDIVHDDVFETFIAGAQWQKEQMIIKACEYLEENLLDFWSQKITNTDYFIEDFKQAMEE